MKKAKKIEGSLEVEKPPFTTQEHGLELVEQEKNDVEQVPTNEFTRSSAAASVNRTYRRAITAARHD
jgi:hypothetical protein